jgi:hypothetical protein
MEESVWKRIDFENYKRLTKQERLEFLKSKVSPKRKLSKKE